MVCTADIHGDFPNADLGIVQARAPLPVLCRLLLLVFLCPLGSLASAGEWETIHRDDEVFVEQRPYGNSPLMELRGRTRVQASLNALMALLKDADYNQDWVYRSGGATILEESGYAQAYVHGVVDAPWPMQDRDTVVRFDYRQDPDTLVITIEITNFPDFIPHEDNLVRVPDFGGFWRLTPLPDGYVEITYQVHGDPGGLVPTWVANYAAELSVVNTLKNMPEAVLPYRAVISPDVTEPVRSQ